MMRFDFSDLQRWERQFTRYPDQIRFAAARALNDAAEVARTRLATETWPQHVEVRNRNFLRAALTTRGERATKAKLSVTLYDQLGRASLKLHDQGGTKKARRGNLAIPTKGVVASQRPSNLKRTVRKGNLIFQAVGKGKNSRLVLMYKLQPTAKITADVPLRRDFNRYMREEMARSFPKRFREAVASRR